MAAYNGTLVTSPIAVDSPDKVGSALADWTLELPIIKGVGIGVAAMTGTYGNNFPLEKVGNTYTSVRTPGYVDDYYYRFWVYPDGINEFVLADVVTTVSIWNAFFETANCVAQDVTNPDEIIIDNPTGEPPFSLRALWQKTFTVTIPEDGAAQFTSVVTWDFGTLGEATLTVTGIRLVVFGYLPLLGLVERLRYKTDIIRAKSTTEQRICLRDAPRQEFQETIYLANETAQSKLDALLHSQHKRAWGLPIWTQYTQHNGTIALGDTTISIDTTYADYRDGGLAIIWQSESSYEVVNVETVATTGLTLSSGTLHAWTGTKCIAPLRIAYMQSKASRDASPDHDGSFAVTFMVYDTARVEDYGVDLTHDGLPVLIKPSYVEDRQDVSLDADTVLTDYDVSDFDVVSNSDYPIMVQSHTFKTDSRAEAWALRQFFDYIRGRQVAFYVPTFKGDLIQTSSLAATGVAFNVQNIGLAANMGVNDLRTDLMFVFPDGTVIPRKITGIVENGTEETVTIDAASGVAIEPGDCEICFLDRCRLTSDDVQIDWEEPDFATCQVNLTRVKV